MASLALIPGSSTKGSAAAQALRAVMLESDGGEQQWLLNEISGYNVPVKRRCFPKEATRLLREARDDTLSLALYLHSSSPLAFSAFALFVLSQGFFFALYQTDAREVLLQLLSQGDATCGRKETWGHF